LVVQDYFANSGGNYSAFSTICSRISDELRNDQQNASRLPIAGKDLYEIEDQPDNQNYPIDKKD
jgi:hypothetical protein